MRLEKWRNVNKCSLRADYFFGSREGFRADPSDIEARIVSLYKRYIIYTLMYYRNILEREFLYNIYMCIYNAERFGNFSYRLKIKLTSKEFTADSFSVYRNVGYIERAKERCFIYLVVIYFFLHESFNECLMIRQVHSI